MRYDEHLLSRGKYVMSVVYVQVLEMGQCDRGKRAAGGEDDNWGQSSKRQRKATQEKVEEMWVSSSSGSEYMAEESGGESSTVDTVSLEVERTSVDRVVVRCRGGGQGVRSAGVQFRGWRLCGRRLRKPALWTRLEVTTMEG